MILFITNIFSQDFEQKQLYILDEEPIIKDDEEGRINYYIILKSIDSIFINDAYIFNIPNRIGFDDFSTLKDIKKEINLDTVVYVKKNKLKSMEPWVLHNYLSTNKIIYLITKNNTKQSKEPIFYEYKIIYNGTLKDLEFIQF